MTSTALGAGTALGEALNRRAGELATVAEGALGKISAWDQRVRSHADILNQTTASVSNKASQATQMRERHTIGVESIMWSSDYPHSETSWPESKPTIDKDFADVPEDEKYKMIAGNAVALYGLN